MDVALWCYKWEGWVSPVGVRYRSPYYANDLLAFAGPQQQKNLKLEMKLGSHQQKRENPGKEDCLRKILQ